MQQQTLPEGISEGQIYISERKAVQAITNYCNSCGREKGCPSNLALRKALGENYFYLPDCFLTVNVAQPMPHGTLQMMLCSDYQNPQPTIPGVQMPFPAGVMRLLEVLAMETRGRMGIAEKVSH